MPSGAMVVVDANAFGDTIMELVQEVAEADEEQLKKDVQKAARATADELRNGALTPASSGEYAAGWHSTTEEDMGHITVVVHNTSKPGLTHLLEKGHEKFIHGVDTGTRVRAYPHIEPAYEVGADKLRSLTAS